MTRAHTVTDADPLDKADYSTEILKQWLIENTRTPRLPLFRDSILRPLNIENTQPFLEVGQLVTHEGKDLLESEIGRASCRERVSSPV